MSAPTEVQDVGADWRTRARRAAADVEAKRQALTAAIELRDHLLVRCYDQRYPVSDLADAFLIARSRVQQIVAARG